jgi:hypothetical protein
MTTINRTTQQDRDRKIIAATQKHLSNQASIVVAGVSYTPPALIAFDSTRCYPRRCGHQRQSGVSGRGDGGEQSAQRVETVLRRSQSLREKSVHGSERVRLHSSGERPCASIPHCGVPEWYGSVLRT